jgi:hypothetical protein
MYGVHLFFRSSNDELRSTPSVLTSRTYDHPLMLLVDPELGTLIKTRSQVHLNLTVAGHRSQVWDLREDRSMNGV